MAFPYLKYGCSLEINSAQTATYLANRCEFCDETPKATLQVSTDCEVLNFFVDDEGEIVPHSWSRPLTVEADWVTSAEPHSDQFIGMIVEDISSPAHITRAITPKVSGSGGAILETPRPTARQFEVTVLLFACSREGMEYGFRYLTNTLVGGGCEDPCTLCDLEYRDACSSFDGAEPTLDEFNEGLWVLHNVGVVRSPEWGDHPAPGLSDYVRRVRFTLASELPWKFKCSETELEWTAFDAPPTLPCGSFAFEKLFCGQSELFAAVVEPSVVGETAMIIEVQAGSRPLRGIEVQIIPDEQGWVCDPETAPAGFVSPDPCDIIYIEDLPARYTLNYDTSRERVTVTTNTGKQVDGTPYLSFDGKGGPPTFPTIRCGSYCVKVLVDECSVSSGASAYIESVHREF